jgi:hypothetical protein
VHIGLSSNNMAINLNVNHDKLNNLNTAVEGRFDPFKNINVKSIASIDLIRSPTSQNNKKIARSSKSHQLLRS